MTDMYDEKKVPEFSLPPYPHEDHSEVSNLFLERDLKKIVHMMCSSEYGVGRREVSPAAIELDGEGSLRLLMQGIILEIYYHCDPP
eukprot:scaffold4888_cov104-Skeletonema_marinoi.AAC.1